MSEAPLLDHAAPAVRYLHRCFACRGYAAFGFTTRRGVIWTCMGHRDDGERELQPPIMISRSTQGG